MEGCTAFDNTTGNKTTAIFVKDNVIMGKRITEINGKYKVERWYNAAGKPHREGDLPAVIEYDDDKITCQRWYKDGECHRDGDLPAIIHYKDGKITSQFWYKDGKWHREGDLPAIILYEDGEIIIQRWYKDGKQHRDGRPAEICYKNGKITRQYWCKDGKYYREIGPSGIRIENGIVKNYWHVNYSELDYLDVPEAQRLSPEFRQTIHRLPLPIGQPIAHHFMEVWPFVPLD